MRTSLGLGSRSAGWAFLVGGLVASSVRAEATNAVSTLAPVVVWGARERALAASVQDAPWAATPPALSVRAQGELPEDILRGMLEESYRLVAAGLPKAQRAALGLLE